jgi:glucosyl-dolichyl phosphate glucuronosyltransferase
MSNAVLDVSVVICAYTEERWDNLVAAVASLESQSTPPREIILVVDNNTDLFERARSHLLSTVVIENREQRGLSGARNSGVAIAEGMLIAFLDDDAIAEPDWLELLSRCCQNPCVLGAGGIVEPLWMSLPPAWFPREFYWVVGCTYQPVAKEAMVVRNPYGGCTCIRREVFEVVGGFRNGIGRVGALPMGCEETELCIRAHQYWPNHVFLCEPKAKIHHTVASSRATWHYFWSRCYAEGLSKAIVARYVGMRDTLSSERVYVLRILPLAFMRNFVDGCLHLDLASFSRSGAIVTGLFMTIAGYVVGSFAQLCDLSRIKKSSVGSDRGCTQSLHLNN